MIDATVLAELESGKKEKGTAEKKHYIPFTKEEFATLREQYGKPGWMPQDFKEVLQAIGSGKFLLSVKR